VLVVVLSLGGSSDSIGTSSLAVPVITMRLTTNRLSRRGSLSHDGGEEAEKGDGESGGLHLDVVRDVDVGVSERCCEREDVEVRYERERKFLYPLQRE
jgi:hypothetical protein